jgi:Protein of unknown function (DUF1524)
VLPERWAEYWTLAGRKIPADVVFFPHLAQEELSELTGQIRVPNSQLHTLGNLTLLNKYLNPAASNGSFDTKRVEYKHSVLRLNRYFDALATWDEEAITGRGRILGKALCEIWPRPAAD